MTLIEVTSIVTIYINFFYLEMSKIILLTIITALLGFNANAKFINYDRNDKGSEPEKIIEKLIEDKPITIVNYNYSASKGKNNMATADLYPYLARKKDYMSEELFYKEDDQVVDEKFIESFIRTRSEVGGYNLVLRSNIYSKTNPDKIIKVTLIFFLIY